MWMLAVALTAIVGVWVALFIVRIHAHQANVDDFAYAQLSRTLLQSPDPFSAILQTGQASPLVPVLATPGVAVAGLYGAMSVELPILCVLCIGAFVLARTWLSIRASALVTLFVGLNAAVLGYAVMFNFALASTASVVWCFATYLRSERMHRLGWSAACGLSFAALILSRSMAPVYALPLVLVIGVDALWSLRKSGPKLGRPVLLALGLVLVIAGPWWIRSGSQAMHYLFNSGYQPSSGNTNRGALVSPQAVFNRSRWELLNLGWIQSILLGAALAASLVTWLRSAHDEKFKNLWMLWIWSALTLLILSSSNNLGTAFGLPIIVILIVVCGVVLGRSIRRERAFAAAVAILLVLAVSSAGQFSASRSAWWPGPPYRKQMLDSGATRRTNVDLLAAQVAAAIGPGRTVIVVPNMVLNVEGITWADPHTDSVQPAGQNPTAATINSLRTASSLITGSVPISFVQPVDQGDVESAAIRRGFHRAKVWNISPTNQVVLWNRGSPAVATARTPQVVRDRRTR